MNKLEELQQQRKKLMEEIKKEKVIYKLNQERLVFWKKKCRNGEFRHVSFIVLRYQEKESLKIMLSYIKHRYMTENKTKFIVRELTHKCNEWWLNLFPFWKNRRYGEIKPDGKRQLRPCSPLTLQRVLLMLLGTRYIITRRNKRSREILITKRLIDKIMQDQIGILELPPPKPSEVIEHEDSEEDNTEQSIEE